MAWFKSKKQKEIEQKMLVRRTINSMEKQIVRRRRRPDSSGRRLSAVGALHRTKSVDPSPRRSANRRMAAEFRRNENRRAERSAPPPRLARSAS